MTNSSENKTKSAPSNGLTPYTGMWGEEQLLHLIRRTLFGVTIADHKYFLGKTLNQCLDLLLLQSPTPSPPVNVYNDDSYTDPDVPFGKTWVYADFGDPNGMQNGKRVDNLKAWWVGQMINQDCSLTEKMTLFWSNHLATQMKLMKDCRLDYGYLALIRSFALGNFKKLIREMTTNPGMLEYLNANVNTAAAPNENYSRELQELFTVGKGPDSYYNEADVKEAARILTGWETEDRPGGVFCLFNAVNHDTGDKQFSSFYNNNIITGKEGQKGATETDELIDMIFKQREVAKYVCRNLYRWFVYYNIDKTIESNIIDPLADILIDNNYEIKPVLRTLLGSEHFFDSFNRSCQIKNPIDHLIGACRQFGITSFPTNLKMQYEAWSVLAWNLKLMGMDPGDPPNVAGWPASYQYPVFSEIWINSTTLTMRNSITDALSSLLGLGGNGVNLSFDLLAFTCQLSNPSDPNNLIEESSKYLCAVPFIPEQIFIFKNILLSGQTSDYYWTSAWNDYVANPTDELMKNIVQKRLIPYYTHLLQRSEYQLI